MTIIPYIKTDNSISYAWISPDRKYIFIVSQDEILKINFIKPESKTSVLKFQSPVVSGWFNNEDRSLVLLTRKKICVIDIKRWTIRREVKLREEHVHLLQGVKDDHVWVTTIPSVWCSSSGARTKSPFLYIVGTPSVVLVIDIKTEKVVSKKERDLSRGQYLSQFLSCVTDSVHMTPLSSLVTLVSSSLSCSFIKSSLSDVVISRSQIVIQTVDGDVWAVSRKAAGKMKSLLMTKVSKLSLVGEVLTLITADGAVYCVDPDKDSDCGDSIIITRPSKLKNNGKLSDVLQRKVETLNRVGASATEVDGRLEQIQVYQYLEQCSQQNIENFFTFETEFNASVNLLRIKFGLRENNLKFSGKVWFMKIDLTSEVRTSLRIKLPEMFTSSTENISTSLHLNNFNNKCDSFQVSAYLIFHAELAKIGSRNIHMPAVKVAERIIPVNNCENQTNFNGEDNFLTALGKSDA